MSKEALAKLKAEDNAAWMQKVRSCRVAPDEPNGLANADVRKYAIASFVKTLKQGYGVVERAPVYFLNEARFLAYQKHFENLGEEEAKLAWTRSLADEAVARRGSGAGVELAVSGWPVTEGYRYREMTSAIGQSVALDTEAAASTALDEVVSAGANASSLYGPVFGPMGDVLRPGSSTSPPECAGRVGIVPLTGDAPPVNSVVPEAEFAKLAALRAGAHTRILRPRPSDVESVAKKRRRNESTTGVTGRLAEVQFDAVAKYQTIIRDYGKNNVCKKLKDFYTSWQRRLPVQFAEFCGRYEDVVCGIPMVLAWLEHG